MSDETPDERADHHSDPIGALAARVLEILDTTIDDGVARAQIADAAKELADVYLMTLMGSAALKGRFMRAASFFANRPAGELFG